MPPTNASPQETSQAPSVAPSAPAGYPPYLWGTGAVVGGIALLAGVYFFVLPKAGDGGVSKVYHVGILNALDYFAPTIDGFKQKMTELGSVEGKNIVYDIQKAPAPVGNQAILKKFVDDKVDLILSFPTEASLEAKEVTAGTGIPVVFADAAIEGNTLIESLRSPGGNVTGVRFPVPEIATNRLEILHELVPQATRIWIPFLKDYPTVAPSLAAIQPLADSLRITLIEAPFSTPDEVKAYLDAHDKNPDMDAILLIPEPISILPPFIDPIYAFADVHKIPVAGIVLQDGDTGPAFSFMLDVFSVGELAAPLADKIFKGTSAGSIPVVTSESVFEINYKVTQKLGLVVSESLLSIADRVVR